MRPRWAWSALARVTRVLSHAPVLAGHRRDGAGSEDIVTNWNSLKLNLNALLLCAQCSQVLAHTSVNDILCPCVLSCVWSPVWLVTRDPGSPLVVSGFISRHLDLSSRISQTQLKIVNQKIIFRKSDPARSRPISYSPLSEPPWYCNSISGSRGARNNRKIFTFSPDNPPPLSYLYFEFSDSANLHWSPSVCCGWPRWPRVDPGLCPSYSHIYNVSLSEWTLHWPGLLRTSHIVQVTDTANFAHFLEFVTQNIGKFLLIFSARKYARCINTHTWFVP